MDIKQRVRVLEKLLNKEDSFRVLLVRSDQDEAEELSQYRRETGFRGPIVVLDEDDSRL